MIGQRVRVIDEESVWYQQVGVVVKSFDQTYRIRLGNGDIIRKYKHFVEPVGIRMPLSPIFLCEVPDDTV